MKFQNNIKYIIPSGDFSFSLFKIGVKYSLQLYGHNKKIIIEITNFDLFRYYGNIMNNINSLSKDDLLKKDLKYRKIWITDRNFQSPSYDNISYSTWPASLNIEIEGNNSKKHSYYFSYLVFHKILILNENT